MGKKRIKLEVYLDLDQTPGKFHSKESARNVVDHILKQSIPEYNPAVSTTNYSEEY